MVFRNAQEWYHGLVAELNESSNSGLFLQVVVLNAMKPRRLSSRIIIQVSLWTVIIIVLTFIIFYTFVLTYMNKHVLPVSMQMDTNDRQLNTRKYAQNVHKIRLKPKLLKNSRQHNLLEDDNTLHVTYGDNTHRKMLWNSSDYYNGFNTLPECYSNSSLLSILITSSPEHFEQRLQIRKTWCNPLASGQLLHAWQCIFLIGQTTKHMVDTAVEQEAYSFQDILRGTYLDSYRNLTYKVLHGLNWSCRLCPTQFTLKTDDDCFVNTVQLYMFLRDTNRVKSKLYVGNVNNENRKVIRNKHNKWSVPVDSYASDYYPPYASGSGYVLSHDMVTSVVSESHYHIPIPNEDAFVGIVAETLGVKPVSSSRFTLFTVGLRLCNYLYVFVSHSVQPQDHAKLHGNMMRAPHLCKRNAEATRNWL